MAVSRAESKKKSNTGRGVIRDSKFSLSDFSARGKVLGTNFFNRSVLDVARELLGKVLVRKLARGAVMENCIVEVEAYDGFKDQASHASRGVTPRCEVMFGPAGYWYVYFIYGMHWMLNAVTGEKGYPAAVLIRGVHNIIGPGRVARFFSVDRTFNGSQISKKEKLWIEDRGIHVPTSLIVRAPRVGVSYAGEVWANKPYRFLILGYNNYRPSPHKVGINV